MDLVKNVLQDVGVYVSSSAMNRRFQGHIAEDEQQDVESQKQKGQSEICKNI